jgi:hypothetical protein
MMRFLLLAAWTARVGLAQSAVSDTLPRLRPPSRPPLPRLRTAQNLSVSWAVLLCDSFWAVLLCVHGLSTERLNWLSTPIQSAVLTKFELVFVYSPDKVLCRHESKPAFWTTYMDKTATGIRKEGNINPRDSCPRVFIGTNSTVQYTKRSYDTQTKNI